MAEPQMAQLRAWRAMRITAITELTQPSRYVTQLTMVVTQLALTWRLWRALYAGVRVSAGLSASVVRTLAPCQPQIFSAPRTSGSHLPGVRLPC
jgi:hypothetical protein